MRPITNKPWRKGLRRRVKNEPQVLAHIAVTRVLARRALTVTEENKTCSAA